MGLKGLMKYELRMYMGLLINTFYNTICWKLLGNRLLLGCFVSLIDESLKYVDLCVYILSYSTHAVLFKFNSIIIITLALTTKYTYVHTQDTIIILSMYVCVFGR